MSWSDADVAYIGYPATFGRPLPWPVGAVSAEDKMLFMGLYPTDPQAVAGEENLVGQVGGASRVYRMKAGQVGGASRVFYG